jgi:hypothetical protein
MALMDTTGESMRRLENTQDIMGSAAVAKKIVNGEGQGHGRRGTQA